jgi:hypothetical protein
VGRKKQRGYYLERRAEAVARALDAVLLPELVDESSSFEFFVSRGGVGKR